MTLAAEAREALKKVVDPEIGVNIVDLGLVYDIEERQGRLKVLATLTSPACPLGPMIVEDAKRELGKLAGVTAVDVEITFQPPWSPEMMTEEGKKELAFVRQGMM